jgi:hypothetical protein
VELIILLQKKSGGQIKILKFVNFKIKLFICIRIFRTDALQSAIYNTLFIHGNGCLCPVATGHARYARDNGKPTVSAREGVSTF